jgi:AAA family ATP:ADP antiporter
VFYGLVFFFIVFFALFALLIYPNAATLHPTAFVDSLASTLPSGFAAPLAIIRNWT